MFLTVLVVSPLAFVPLFLLVGFLVIRRKMFFTVLTSLQLSRKRARVIACCGIHTVALGTLHLLVSLLLQKQLLGAL